MDWFFGAVFTIFTITALLFFAVYWKPILIFSLVMLTAIEPYVGIPLAFLSSFSIMLWFERKTLDLKCIIEILKFAVYVTIAATLIGFVLNTVFDGSSGYGSCSRGNPTGC